MFRLLFLLSLGVSIYLYFKKQELPKSETLDASLKQEPLQTPSNQKSFIVQYLGASYEIFPKAEYTIQALVASHNDPYAFGDIYHDETSFDTKDLCLLWGDNIQNDVQRKIDVWNGSFSCYVKYPRGVNFNMNQLSNNHLITDSDEIRDLIDEIRPGDQIRIRGTLVDYKDIRTSSLRKTSLVRWDSYDNRGPNGSTGCEVLFVHHIEWIQKAPTKWRNWYYYSLLVTILLGLLSLMKKRKLTQKKMKERAAIYENRRRRF